MTSLEQLKQLPSRNYSVKIKQRFNTIKIPKLQNFLTHGAVKRLELLTRLFAKLCFINSCIHLYEQKGVQTLLSYPLPIFFAIYRLFQKGRSFHSNLNHCQASRWHFGVRIRVAPTRPPDYTVSVNLPFLKTRVH